MKDLSIALAKNDTVENIYLDGCDLDKDAVEELMNALKQNKKVVNLQLGDNGTGDGMAIAVADCIRTNQSLQVIRLSFNEITDTGAQALLDALPQNSSVNSLPLDGNHISDSLLAKLESLVDSKRGSRIPILSVTTSPGTKKHSTSGKADEDGKKVNPLARPPNRTDEVGKPLRKPLTRTVIDKTTPFLARRTSSPEDTQPRRTVAPNPSPLVARKARGHPEHHSAGEDTGEVSPTSKEMDEEMDKLDSVISPSGTRARPGRSPELSRTAAQRRAALESGGSSAEMLALQQELEKMKAELAIARQSAAAQGSSTNLAVGANDNLARPSSPGGSAFREITGDDLEIEEKIGKGAFAKVYRANWLGMDVAVKKLKQLASRQLATNWDKEMGMLAKMRHPNIVLLLGGCHNSKETLIVTEYMEGGSLADLLPRLRDEGKTMPWKQKYSIALDIARGMAYLHSSNPMIIHRDLKSMNILLDSHGRAKVCDFGLSRDISSDATMTKMVGTPHWMAPEILKGEKYSEKADVYSYALLLWELLTGEIPYANMGAVQLIGRLVKDPNYRVDIPENTPSEWSELIKWCWDADPGKRPQFGQILDYMRTQMDPGKWDK
eukprot:TRINITY_DN1595_c0_g1_i4.p1 TRINITY_DN1595_c0_g1~~TRINITY_DN1595_c0_g1_i4.p1  ORF type:complete len:608 (+),score=82.55 TRINITY_DN1595_c0_g1_i4:147-1970(+)